MSDVTEHPRRDSLVQDEDPQYPRNRTRYADTNPPVDKNRVDIVPKGGRMLQRDVTIRARGRGLITVARGHGRPAACQEWAAKH